MDKGGGGGNENAYKAFGGDWPDGGGHRNQLAIGSFAAQAATGDATIAAVTGTVKKANGDNCSSGQADLILYRDGQWQTEESADVTGGTFTITGSGSYDSGTPVTVRVQCWDDGVPSGGEWFGGRIDPPGSPTFDNSKTLIAGSNDLDFATLTMPAAASITVSGSILKSDGGTCVDGTVGIARYDAYRERWSYVDYDAAANGTYTHTSSSFAAGTRITVSVDCGDGDYLSAYFGGNSSGAPTDANSKLVVDGASLDFGALTVTKQVPFGGKVLLADGSVLPSSDTGRIGVIAYLCVHGAACDANSNVESLYVSDAGIFSDEVSVGTYDLVLVASGQNEYTYPESATRITNVVVPDAGLKGLSVKLAAGPAAVIKGAAITGPATVGSTLSAAGTIDTVGYPTPAPSLGYQWIVDGQVRSNASTYQVQASDGGKVVVLRQTVSRPAFDTATADARVTIATPPAPVVTPAPAPVDRRAVSSVSVKFATLKNGKKGTATVRVKAGPAPIGAVRIVEGSKLVGQASLVVKSKGVVKIKLAKLSKGKHVLSVTYAGSSTFKPSAKTVTVRVKK